jgi:hypothetical protein
MALVPGRPLKIYGGGGGGGDHGDGDDGIEKMKFSIKPK